MADWFKRVAGEFALNNFIFRRNKQRGVGRWLIMWRCLLACAITFPLVFGWIHFETLPGDTNSYRTLIFGFPTLAFPVHSITGFAIFHGLVWASILVIAGVMLAMRRRMRDHFLLLPCLFAHDQGAAALQQFGEDFLPLVLLFAVSVTGLKVLSTVDRWRRASSNGCVHLGFHLSVAFRNHLSDSCLEEGGLDGSRADPRCLAMGVTTI